MIIKPNIVERFIDCNYTKGRADNKITGVILHTEGYPPYRQDENSNWYDSRLNATYDRTLYHWFSSLEAQSSAHFYVTFSGKIEQYVRLEDTAWQTVGDGNQNVQTVGIEHQDNGYWEVGRESRYTDAQIKASAHLLAWLSQEYGFPIELKKAGGVSIHNMHDKKPCPGSLPYNDIIKLANLLITKTDMKHSEAWSIIKIDRPDVENHLIDGKPYFNENNILEWVYGNGAFEMVAKFTALGIPISEMTANAILAQYIQYYRDNKKGLFQTSIENKTPIITNEMQLQSIMQYKVGDIIKALSNIVS